MKRIAFFPLLMIAALLAGGAARIVQDQCGPFTDVTPGFCPYILEIYYLGITVGTSATTFSPDDPLTRGQGAVFVAKGINQTLARSSRRAALGQWWTTHNPGALPPTPVGGGSVSCASDGSDVWVPASVDGTVTRVRASDGRVLETWTGALQAIAAAVAMGRIFVVGQVDDGRMYMIDPSQPAGEVTTVAAGLGTVTSVAFDGNRLWVTSLTKTLSIITPGSTLPWTTTTVGGFAGTSTLLFDGANMWVTDYVQNTLMRLDANGKVLQTVSIEDNAGYPVFDGENIWVPSLGGVLTVVRASTGTIVTQLSGNGMDGSVSAGFDGQRILVVNAAPETVSLFRAGDLAPLGEFPTAMATVPRGVCSDGINFWVTQGAQGGLERF